MTKVNIACPLEVETLVTLDRVNFILDDEKLDFVGYEFWTNEPVIYDGDEGEQWLFRIDIDKKTGISEIYCAYSEDFDLMEEVDHLFDVEKLLAEIKKFEAENGLGNSAEEYMEYVEEHYGEEFHTN